MRILAVLIPALLTAAVLSFVDGWKSGDERPAAAQRLAASQRPDGARQIRERARTRRPEDARWTRGPRGFATYYARVLDGRETASGRIFDNDHLVAAHPRYPFGTKVRVTNLRNGRSVVVTVVDRGPVRSARASGVIIDLSRAAAERLDFVEEGRARVRLEIDLPEREGGAAMPSNGAG